MRYLTFLLLTGGMIPILFACTSYEGTEAAPEEFCSDGFRDTWWLIENDKLWNADVCFIMYSDGTMQAADSFGGDWGTHPWKCTGGDEYIVKGQGKATVDYADSTDVWAEVTFKNFIHIESTLSVCPFK